MESDYMEQQEYSEKRIEASLSEPVSLLGEISKRIRIIAAENARQDKVPKSEKLILQCLMNANGATQLDIVRFTGFKPPTISILMKKMESAGYITRKPDEFDLRAMRVFITDDGKKVYFRAVQNVKSLEEIILNNVTDDERKALSEILLKIKSNLN